jgi:hypothetical protein
MPKFASRWRTTLTISVRSVGVAAGIRLAISRIRVRQFNRLSQLAQLVRIHSVSMKAPYQKLNNCTRIILRNMSAKWFHRRNFRERQASRQAGWRTDGRMSEQKDRQTNTQTDRNTGSSQCLYKFHIPPWISDFRGGLRYGIDIRVNYGRRLHIGIF